MIEVENLTKDYRQHFWTASRRVLNRVSFQVERGEIFGFLGPNGSGKSTTIKILFQIIFPTEGRAWLFGKDLSYKESRRKIGFLPENSYFYDYLTATQFLIFHGKLMGLEKAELCLRIPQVLELVGMKGTEQLQLRNFSKGMLQRIGLAQALIHDPELIILDEPMTGLDPVGRKEIRDLMIHLRDRGKTIFFSTHILSDVETVCDRIAILNKGKLLSCGSLEELLSVDIKYVEMMWTAQAPLFFEFMNQTSGRRSRTKDTFYLQCEPFPQETPEAFEKRLNDLVQKGQELGGILHLYSPKKDSLEDVFVKQVGHLETRV